MMARPQQDAIETFMSITGASEAAAVEKLQAYAGDLNEAVNAYFNEGEHVLPRPERDEGPQPDWMEENEPAEMEVRYPVEPFPSIATSFPTFGPINRGLMSSPIFDGRSTSRMPFRNSIVSHPRNVRNIPIESKDEEGQVADENSAPAIEEVSASVHAQGPEVRGTVIFDDDDELPSTASSTFRSGSNSRGGYYSTSYPHGREPIPSAPQVAEEPIAAIEEGNAIEEEMLRAAIEASKREAEEANMRQQHGLTNDQLGSGVDRITPISDDDDFARAVSLSIKTAQQEKAWRELEGVPGSGEQKEDYGNLLERERPNMGRRQGPSSSNIGTSSQEKMDVEDPHQHLDVVNIPDETEEPEEQPLLRHRSIRRTVSGTAEAATHPGQDLDSPPSSSGPHSITGAPQLNGDPFHEWGISSQEHDEAVMLEAALFGGIPEPYRRRIPQPPSPTLEAERLLREQQDDEYLASLQADREKAEAQRMEEEVAREAAAAEEKRQQEEALRRLQEEEESERKLAAKKASLPPEPSVEDENAVTLLVRMPDGSRRGRRFLKSDRLQSLFDFIDIGGGVKPGTYRLVRQYPRRAFTDGEHGSSLSDLGLTSKQEALFLELI